MPTRTAAVTRLVLAILLVVSAGPWRLADAQQDTRTGPITVYPRPEPGATLEGGAPVEGSAGANDFGWNVSDDGGAGLSWLQGGTVVTHRDGQTTRRSLEIEIPRHTPEGTVVLRGGTVITMRDREVIRDADVVVNNRTTAVGLAGEDVPDGAHVIRVNGKFIVPGFVDIHAHFPTPGELYEVEDPAALANLAFGVTTLRNPQVGPDVFALTDLVEADALPAPRIFATGPGIFSFADVQSLDHARALLRRYRDEYGTHLIKSYLPWNRQQRQWIVEASRELEMMPTTEGGADTKANLAHALDGFSGNEHAVPVAPFFDGRQSRRPARRSRIPSRLRGLDSRRAEVESERGEPEPAHDEEGRRKGLLGGLFRARR